MLYNASGPPRRPFLMTEDFSIGQSRCSGCLNDAFRCDPSSNKFVAHRFDTKHAQFQANSDFTKVAETRAMCFSGANCGRKPNRATQNTIQRAYKGGPHAAEPTNQKPSLLQPKKHGPNSPNCPFASPACDLPARATCQRERLRRRTTKRREKELSRVRRMQRGVHGAPPVGFDG